MKILFDRFCHYFLHKFDLSADVDNTPPLIRTASALKKVNYLHELVATALKDMMPHFKQCLLVDPLLHDFPVASGKRKLDKVYLRVSFPYCIYLLHRMMKSQAQNLSLFLKNHQELKLR